MFHNSLIRETVLGNIQLDQLGYTLCPLAARKMFYTLTTLKVS